MAARPRLRRGFGDTGLAGRSAVWTTVALIGEVDLPGDVSSSVTKPVKAVATARASSCARAGTGSFTVISRITVSGATVLVICDDRAAADSVRCSLSMTRCARSSPVTRSAYEATRCCENNPPWYASEEPPLGVEMKSLEVDAYSGVVRAVKTEAAARASNMQATMSFHRRPMVLR